MIKRLSDFIGSFQAFDASTLQFHLPDKERLLQSINLIERAQDLGRNNLPRADDADKDFLAQEIDSHIYAVIRQAKSNVSHHTLANLDIYQANLAIGDSNDEHIIYKDAMNKLHETSKLAVIEQFTRRRSLINFEKFFKSFRDEHHLMRPAMYPPSLVFAWGVVFLCAMLETFVNAYTLKDVHPEGFSGVLTETLGFTAVNISLAISAGVLIRKKNLGYTVQKIMGFILPFMILIVMVILNFFFGHYRDALSSIGNNLDSLSINQIYEQYSLLGGAALARLISDPFGLNDFKSYLLILVGIMMGLYAMYKSYNNDDEVPKYGKYTRELNTLTEDYHFFLDNLYSEMNAVVKDGISKLQASWIYRRQSLEQINNRIERLKNLESNYNLWFKNMEAIGNSLYGQYRTECLKFRSDGINPKCFSIKFTVPEEAKVEFERKTKVSVNIPPINERAEKLQNALKAYMDHFKAIENLSPDELELREFDFKATKIDSIADKFKVTAG